MEFFQAEPKDQVIKKLKEEQDELNRKIWNIDTVFSNDTDISQRQLSYMSIQSSIMNSLVSVIDERIEDLEQEK